MTTISFLYSHRALGMCVCKKCQEVHIYDRKPGLFFPPPKKDGASIIWCATLLTFLLLCRYPTSSHKYWILRGPIRASLPGICVSQMRRRILQSILGKLYNLKWLLGNTWHAEVSGRESLEGPLWCHFLWQKPWFLLSNISRGVPMQINALHILQSFILPFRVLQKSLQA